MTQRLSPNFKLRNVSASAAFHDHWHAAAQLKAARTVVLRIYWSSGWPKFNKHRSLSFQQFQRWCYKRVNIFPRNLRYALNHSYGKYLPLITKHYDAMVALIMCIIHGAILSPMMVRTSCRVPFSLYYHYANYEDYTDGLHHDTRHLSRFDIANSCSTDLARIAPDVIRTAMVGELRTEILMEFMPSNSRRRFDYANNTSTKIRVSASRLNFQR